MGVNRIGEVGDQASEGQAAGVSGARFYSGVFGKERARGWDPLVAPFKRIHVSPSLLCVHVHLLSSD